MKTLIRNTAWRCLAATFILLVALLAKIPEAVAQLPDCSSGTVMYGVFSPVTPTVNNDSTELRPITYATAAVGSLMGGRRYYIRRSVSGTFYYGSSAMVVSPITNRFYMFTQMGNGAGGAKAIVAIDPVAPTATGITIGTTPGSMNDYHFVKAGISPNGFGYAVGVHRTPTSDSSLFNPVIRFNICNTAGCSTPQLIGYLPATNPIMKRRMLYNGDIAFDQAGNLYFLASAFEDVNGTTKYTDARLFKIDVGNIPGPGTGIIPMNFIADFNNLDSTGCSGIAFDPSGNLYFSLRRYLTDNNPSGPYTTEVYMAYDSANAFQMTGFGPIPSNTSLGDLASCYFPLMVLDKNDIKLSGRYQQGNAYLKWEAGNNSEAHYFELQSSTNGSDFATIATVYPTNTGRYNYTDPNNGAASQKYYRIRQVMQSGVMRYYSNVVKVVFNKKLNLVARPQPNPFQDQVSFTVEVKSAQTVSVRIIDQSGRIVRSRQFSALTGENKYTIYDLAGLKPGVFIAEILVEDEVVREKLVKQ